MFGHAFRYVCVHSDLQVHQAEHHVARLVAKSVACGTHACACGSTRMHVLYKLLHTFLYTKATQIFVKGCIGVRIEVCTSFSTSVFTTGSDCGDAGQHVCRYVCVAMCVDTCAVIYTVE